MRKKIRKILAAAIMLVMVLALAGGVAAESAAENTPFVFDQAGLLSQEEYSHLNHQAAVTSGKYDSGVYVVTVEDYKGWDSDLDRAAQEIYEELNLGTRQDRDGIMLLLSMRERDYILLVHGVFANQAYNSYARDVLTDAFLEEFRGNDFFEGFEAYIGECDHLLSLAAEGTPLTRESNPTYRLLKWLFSLGLGLAAGLIIAAVIRSRMKNVAEKMQADQYIAPGGAEITLRRDQFTHMTQSRVKIETHSSSGGSGGGGGGYSSSSGKF